MRRIVLALLLGSVIVAFFLFSPQARGKFLQAFQGLKNNLQKPTSALFHTLRNGPDSQNPSQESSISGSIKGVQTSQVTEKIEHVGSAIGSFASTVLTTSSASGSPIEVDAVIQQITNHIETIPSSVVEQAKVHYCKQVLIEGGYTITR